MALLSEANRQEEWAKFMRALSSEGERLDINKPELRAFVDAVDDWIEANAASFNNALPTAARTKLTAKQKTRGFMEIAKRRYEVT